MGSFVVQKGMACGTKNTYRKNSELRFSDFVIIFLLIFTGIAYGPLFLERWSKKTRKIKTEKWLILDTCFNLFISNIWI